MFGLFQQWFCWATIQKQCLIFISPLPPSPPIPSHPPCPPANPTMDWLRTTPCLISWRWGCNIWHRLHTCSCCFIKWISVSLSLLSGWLGIYPLWLSTHTFPIGFLWQLFKVTSLLVNISFSVAVHKPPRYRITHHKIKPTTGSCVISDLAVLWDMISYQKHDEDNKAISIRKLFVFVGENKRLFSKLFYFPFYQFRVFFYWNWIALHFTAVLFLNLADVFILFLYCYVSNMLRSTEWNVMECTMTIKSSLKQAKQMERTNTILHNSEAQGFMLLHSSLVCTVMLSLLIYRR